MLLLEDGTTVDGRYDIVGTIGSGGFGSVYKAWQKQFDRFVALKILNTNVLEESDGLGRFEREAKAIAGLQHKNIVAFYGYGVWKEAPYMVMEFIEGTSLQARLAQQVRLAPVPAAMIMKQVCEGLSCAHANGVIHRDLKPTNIMLERGPDGRDVVKLIDFGLVKLMPGYGVPNQKLTEAGYAVGTVHYMSPEQCMAGANIDHRADIYSAAAILYEVVAGEKPFDHDDIVRVMAAQINEAPKPLSAKLGSSPLVDALQAIVNKGLAKDPEDRYQDISEMAADLDSILRGQSGKLAQQGRTSQRLVLPPAAIQQARKKKLRWLLPAVAGLAAAVFFGWQYTNKPPEVVAQSDISELNIYDELAKRDVVPPVEPIPQDLKVALAELDVGYRRHRLGDCKEDCDQLLENAEKQRLSPYLVQLISLKAGQIYNAGEHTSTAVKTLKRALAYSETPDPIMRLDLQEALAQAAWLNHRFAIAHDIWDEMLVNGPRERRKRAQLGLARLALWDWDAKAAKPHLSELDQMMTPEQRGSLTTLLLDITSAACSQDDYTAGALVKQLLSRPFDHPDDTYDDRLLTQDVESAESALLKNGQRDLYAAVQHKTGVEVNEEQLTSSKYHH